MMTERNYAPIVLFAYNRPIHTAQTIEALKQNIGAGETEIYIFCDAAKNENAKPKVQETRDYVNTVTGFKEVHIILREENFGLAKSVIAGVTDVVNRYGRVIVMEDDLVTSPYFLQYMNEALEKYEDAKQVFSITGYSHFPNGNEVLPESYFLKVFSSWSWAIWKDRWALFDENARGWEETKTNEQVQREFDYEYCFDNCLMMKHQMEDKIINSWAIRAYWTMYKNDGMTLFPNQRLCENIGFDGTGVHCNTEGDYKKGQLLEHPVREFPEKAVEWEETKRELVRYIQQKKRDYKMGRVQFYLRHPFQAIKKIIEKLKRG